MSVKRVNERLDQTSKVLAATKSNNSESSVENSEATSGGSRLTQSIEAIDADNVFYETKLDQLNKELEVMNQNLGKKVALDSEIKSLDSLLLISQKRLRV